MHGEQYCKHLIRTSIQIVGHDLLKQNLIAITEQIKLGDSIVVTVVRVTGDKVRLGIEAPSDILVLRDELEPHEQAEAVG